MATEAQERREAERQSWQYRAINQLRGNQTPLGALLLGVIGRNAKHPPWVESGLTIDVDGMCYLDFVNKRYEEIKNMPFIHVEDLKDGWNRLADTIRASDAERVAMFDELRKYVLRDLRLANDILRRM